MQILFLNDWQMVLSYFLVWPLLGMSFDRIANKMGDEHFAPNKFWFKTRSWEKDGFFYKKVFKVHKWKHIIPDGSRAHKEGFQKKKLAGNDPKYLKAFIAETGRAETIHWLHILSFWIFGLWSPPFVVWIMLAFALVFNLPCIIVQRYNRPRLVRILERVKVHE